MDLCTFRLIVGLVRQTSRTRNEIDMIADFLLLFPVGAVLRSLRLLLLNVGSEGQLKVLHISYDVFISVRVYLVDFCAKLDYKSNKECATIHITKTEKMFNLEKSRYERLD